MQLCGQRVPVHAQGALFTGVVQTSCEGEGEVLVTFKEGPTTRCNIGYVTNGMSETFKFAVRGTDCEMIDFTPS